MIKGIVRLHIISYLLHFGKQIPSILDKVYNPFNKLVRGIKKAMRESYTYLFAVAIAGVIIVLGVVTQPLFASPLSWSNLNLFNFGVVLSRFLYALPLIALFVAGIIFIVRQIKKIDNEREKQLISRLTEALKEAFKQALKEDREEQRKKEIEKAGEW
jgi:uncharacterized membrane protein